MPPRTHKQFIGELKRLAHKKTKEDVARFFHADPYANSTDNQFLGVSIGKIFPVAKRYTDLSLADVEQLLESPFYEVRMGGVSIMDFQARAKKISPEYRKALFDLYIRRHDRINNWDMVDRAAPHVVGGYLSDKPRTILRNLAKSKNPWKRRTAIVSTYYFIRNGEVEDTFEIAALLAKDSHELVQKAVGSWIREAGKKDQKRLVTFLNQYSKVMPRTMLRYAVEKLPSDVAAKYTHRSQR